MGDNDNIKIVIQKWFNNSADWQKDLFVNLWKGKDYESSKNRALRLLLKEHSLDNTTFVPEKTMPVNLVLDKESNSQTLLKMVGEVHGVAALTPTKPLEFTDGLNVIYGENGCGKSSYVRILKKAENPKNPTKIYNNVFKETSEPITATLKFNTDGEDHIVHWTPNSQQQCAIRIYDTQVAQQFVEYSNEIVYEPLLLHIFSVMAQIYEELKSDIYDRIAATKSMFCQIPTQISDSPIILRYVNSKKVDELQAIKEDNQFDESLQKELEQINSNFSEANPQKTITVLNTQRRILDDYKREIVRISKYLDDSNIAKFIHSRNLEIEAKKKLDDFIVAQRQVSRLPGFGMDLWKQMWESSLAYKESIKASDDICILCQQNLSEEAKERQKDFNKFYSSTIQEEYIKAHKNFNTEVDLLSKELEENLNLNDIEDKLVVNSFEKEVTNEILSIYKKLFQRAIWLYDYENKSSSQPPLIPAVSCVESFFQKALQEIESRLKSLTSFIENTNEHENRRKQIESIKWIFEHKSDIDTRINVVNYEGCLSCLKSNSLTKTKNTLSEKMITDVYISKFNSELSYLNPSHSIKVELVSDGKKGKTSHHISIKNSKKNKVNEILSEGEYRVVSLAAFLADLNSWNRTQAFIFDDPITSLDHIYEDKVATRLANLSTERQVVVFTHRLAFAESLSIHLSELKSSNNSAKINYIELRRNPLGEPMLGGEYNKHNFKRYLNTVLNDDIPKLKKLFGNGEYDLYEDKLTAACSKLRTVIERGLETELLSGLVTRYNRNICSQKVRYLNAIEESDVDFFDKMMSKYSCFEHSQPTEKTIPLPDLADFEKDIKSLLDWNDSFSKKKKKYN